MNGQIPDIEIKHLLTSAVVVRRVDWEGQKEEWLFSYETPVVYKAPDGSIYLDRSIAHWVSKTTMKHIKAYLGYDPYRAEGTIYKDLGGKKYEKPNL